MHSPVLYGRFFFSEAESFSVMVLIVLLTLDPFGSIGICSC